MNDAAQIRRCSGALRVHHSGLQPPFLPPPPTRRPILKISNRESLRRVWAVNRRCDCREIDPARRNDDVINVTQTKQTPERFLRRGGPLAPPDPRPSFRPSSLRTPPTRDPNLKNSNRESLRLEIDVTQTKQTTEAKSNRENSEVFQPRFQPAHRPSPVKRQRFLIGNEND